MSSPGADAEALVRLVLYRAQGQLSLHHDWSEDQWGEALLLVSEESCRLSRGKKGRLLLH